MSILIIFSIFIISLLFLLLSANFFVKYAVYLAYTIKISPLIIGSTIVALGTSLPELFVGISSIFHQAPTLSLGTVIGSNILNIGLVLALSFILFPVRIGTTKTQKNADILLLTTVFFILPQFITFFSHQAFSYFLLAFALLFLILSVSWGKTGANHEDQKMLIKNHYPQKPIISSLIIVSFSLLAILFSAQFLVWASLKIIEFFFLSREIFGLTIVALGTSLPELITTIVAGLKKEEKLLTGNILGSNILNLLLIGGLTFSVPVKVPTNHSLYLLFLFSFTLIFYLIIKISNGKVVPRFFGFFLLFFCFVYFLTVTLALR